MKSARILLGVFIVSVSVVQLIESGHGLLHHFKNPLHYHKIHSSGDIKNHSLADHDFPKMKFAHEMDEPASPSNFIALAYGFFQEGEVPLFSFHAIEAEHFTCVTEHLDKVYTCPPTPPPLS